MTKPKPYLTKHLTKDSSKLAKKLGKQYTVAIVVILLVTILAVRLLTLSHAESPYASVNAASGTLTSPAQTVSDSTSSSGIAVQFVSPSTTALAIHVDGNQLVNQTGAAVVPRGVNYSGNEYSCVDSAENYSVFQGPTSLAFVQAMETWHIHAVRLSLNEDCWLGINGAKASASGTVYQQAIESFVNILSSQGIYTILDLHNSGPGTALSVTQFPMLDSDHSPAFWTSVANAFKSNPSVIFEPFNEPFIGNDGATINATNGSTPTPWQCWLNGCSITNTNVSPSVTYTAVGMQSIVNTIRATGANNVVMLSGLNFADDLTGWLANKPTDPDNQLVASAHIYGNDQYGASTSALNTDIAPVAAKVPVVFGEIGETYDGSECGDTNTQTIMTWADQHNIGYLPWAYDNWGTCLGLLSSWNGTSINTTNPAGTTYSTYVYDHLRSFP